MGKEWPASPEALAAGRTFLRRAARGTGRIVIAADRDVDGLASGVLVSRALGRLQAGPTAIVPAHKGQHVHHPDMLARVRALLPSALIVVDMGSRGAPLLNDVPTLLIDHHQPRGFPPDATIVSAFGHEPVAATSLLVWELCRPLGDPGDDLWLAVLGTVADLGTDLPFAEMTGGIRRYGRQSVTESVALLNAARRAQDHDVELALGVLERARSPADIATGQVTGVEALRRARASVQRELARCGRTAPKFADRFALLRFSSSAQVHPLLATRWARRLPKFIVIAANDDYIPGRVNFSMRTQLDVNLVELLRGLPLADVDGEFGFGHPQASGGSLSQVSFAHLLTVLGFPARPAVLGDLRDPQASA